MLSFQPKASPFLERERSFNERPLAILVRSPSHGENRGSSPLGSANEINNLLMVFWLLAARYGNYTENILSDGRKLAAHAASASSLAPVERRLCLGPRSGRGPRCDYAAFDTSATPLMAAPGPKPDLAAL